jgi:hypothetical protein
MRKWIGPLGYPLDKIRPIEATDQRRCSALSLRASSRRVQRINRTCSQLDKYSVRTPYEFPDRSVHRTGMRTHRIVPGVIDPHNRQILGILFKAMEQSR